MHELEIESLAFGGEAVGRLDGKVVFVPFAAPGDRVRLRIVQETSSFCRGELLEVLVPGPGRRPPPCPYFGACGGCQWQQLEYALQLEHKQRILGEALSPLGALELLPLAAAPRELGYRRRVRMHWQHGSAGLQLGYHRWRSNELLDVQRCPLLEESLQRGLDRCRELLSGLAGGAGSLAALQGARGEVHVSLRIERGEPGWVTRLARRAGGEAIVGGEVRMGRTRLSFGATALELGGEDEGSDQPPLRGAATAFAQASAAGERALRGRVLEWAAAPGQRVVELHAGIGTFTRALAGQADRVDSLELAPEAVALLRANTAGLPAVRIHPGDALAGARALAASGEQFEVAVLDPPREGSPRIAAALASLGVKRVVYVSCDPMTLTRDLRALGAAGFRPRSVAGLDVMPQTYHIEAVALAER